MSELTTAESQPFDESRPLYWSIRRELWENRSLVIAPLIAAAVAMLGFLINTVRVARNVRGLAALDPVRQRGMNLPYGMLAGLIIVTGLVVGAFYCLDALNSERRDRSILFWKSLPVSDRTTVLAKAFIPMILLPLYTFFVALAAQYVMLLMSTGVFLLNGVSPAALWTRLPLPRMTLVMFYRLTAHALWYAPIYSWFLLLSAWARRAAILWVILPIFAVFSVETLALGTRHFVLFLRYRLEGAMVEAFAVHPAKVKLRALSQLEPLNFLSTPGLWLGLLFAAGCLIAAVRLRRNREPI
jgi:ABC-2 type transport system permease protein